MTLFNAFLLGIIQGLTEFIPVSSTAHLLIAQQLLGIPAGELVFSFLVIVQVGTIFSLLVCFWKDLGKILSACLASIQAILRRDFAAISFDARLGWFILLATLPALLAGYLLKDLVEMLFSMPMLEAGIRLLAAAVLLLLAERLTKKDRSLNAITWLDALIIGLFQVIAVFPGASRSGTTIAAGMLRGLDRSSAARFAFLMSIPVMLAAGAYEMVDVIRMDAFTSALPVLIIGFLTATAVGWLAVKWLLSYLARGSLYVFAIYCAGAGLLCLMAYLA